MSVKVAKRDNKKVVNKESASKAKAKPKPEWNSYMTENEYKLSEAEVVKRKCLYVSKNHLFMNNNFLEKRKVRKPKSAPLKSDKDDASIISDLDRFNEYNNSTLDLVSQRDDLLDDMSMSSDIVKKEAPMKASSKKAVERKRAPMVSHLSTAPLLVDADLDDIVEQINVLTSELKYYEELSGRRSVFNTEDLYDELGDVLSQHLVEINDAGVRVLNQKKVMRYLVNLVCKSMTYLLQSEITIQKNATDYESLSRKVECLLNMNSNAIETGALVSNKAEIKPVDHKNLLAVVNSASKSNDVDVHSSPLPPMPPSLSDIPATLSEKDIMSSKSINSKAVDNFAPRGMSTPKVTANATTPGSVMRIPGTSTSDWLFSRYDPTPSADNDVDPDITPYSRIAPYYAMAEESVSVTATPSYNALNAMSVAKKKSLKIVEGKDDDICKYGSASCDFDDDYMRRMAYEDISDKLDGDSVIVEPFSRLSIPLPVPPPRNPYEVM